MITVWFQQQISSFNLILIIYHNMSLNFNSVCWPLISHLTLFYHKKHKNDNIVNPDLKIPLNYNSACTNKPKIFCDFKYSSKFEDMFDFEFHNFTIVIFALFNHMVLWYS